MIWRSSAPRIGSRVRTVVTGRWSGTRSRACRRIASASDWAVAMSSAVNDAYVTAGSATAVISVRRACSLAPDLNRSEQVDYIARQLPAQVALLRRLLARHLGGELSRTEAGVLNTLSDGRQRITELAELEGLAQPTMTILVKQLEQQGLVTRERHADDGRVVLVDLTERGVAALGHVRAQASAALRSVLTETPDDQIEALTATTEALQALIVLLRTEANS